MSLPTILLLGLLIPLLTAVVIAFFLRKRGHAAAIVAVLSSLGIAGLALYSVYSWDEQPFHVSLKWLQLGDFTLSMGFYFNMLTALMLLVVSIVGTCVHFFSLGYMKSDKSKARYFAGLSLFMFSMLGIVLASNLFMLFIFWELVGLSSYLLINHFFEKNAAAAASKKAFIVNRIGDVGFLIGIIWAYWQWGTVELEALQALSGTQSLNTFLGLCLFCGVLGKSAQLPLHVWLPDAMEGPTPVSALMHAATMVAAGVYLLCRVSFLFTVDALTVITWVGTATAFFAAFCTFGQRDIKKILAYSTLSQLGFMVAVFGLGTAAGLHSEKEYGFYIGIAAALFHLTTHAFFKALLFLSAGSVIHACHHEQDIFRLGGLWKRMSFTFFTFTIGLLAIAGVPFLGAGFFSKDIILFLAYEHQPIVFILLAFTSLLTVTYMGRLWLIAFCGSPRSAAAEKAHEAPWSMCLPLAVLALFSFAGGWVTFYPASIQVLWEKLSHPHGFEYNLILGLSFVFTCIGFGLALWIYHPLKKVKMTEDPLEKKLLGLFSLFRTGFNFDRFYRFYIQKVQQRMADILDFIDRFLIDGFIVKGSAGLVGLIGMGLRLSHTGNVKVYLYWFLAGMLFFWAYALSWL